MGRFPLPVALFSDQCLVDVDPEPRPVADAIAGPFQREQSGKQLGVVEAVVELTRRSARLEPGEIRDGRREMVVPAGGRLEVTRCGTPLKWVRLDSAPFTDRLVRKFRLPVTGWRGQ